MRTQLFPKLLKQAWARRPRGLGLYYLALAGWLATTAMHIPEGYLSPLTSLIMYLLVLPFWYKGVQKLRQTMNARSVPLIALMAAFSFVIMMFNLPLPGGTTGHAVGGALAAILLGPQIASIAISVALIIQAVFFGDGGILAIGANCFNIAVVLPYVAYAVYQALGGKAALTSMRRPVAAAIAGWVGLTMAAFVASVEFGIQPLLFKAADGTPLYAPYPLSVAIPAMVLPHILVASVVEGLATALVVAYLVRTNSPVLQAAEKPALMAEAGSFAKLRWLWVGLAVMVVATPLGLLAPGTAWGEWGTHELAGLGLNFVPAGLQQLETLWGAPLAGYEVPALGNANVGYLLSAVVGIALVALVAWLLTRLLTAGQPTKS